MNQLTAKHWGSGEAGRTALFDDIVQVFKLDMYSISRLLVQLRSIERRTDKRVCQLMELNQPWEFDNDLGNTAIWLYRRISPVETPFKKVARSHFPWWRKRDRKPPQLIQSAYMPTA